MKRAAVYARFSSEKQNERSCDDQIALCRAWAERNGFKLVEEYRDQAISGASTIGRLGLQRLLIDAKERRFEHVICESLDRLSRDQADLATIKKNLAFIDIGISTVQDGEVGAIHVGIKGLLGELYLADLAAKTRRGLSAKVSSGSSGGGLSFGYRNGAVTGELQIDEAAAETVRRIFAEYLAGATAREIAAGLNRDQVPGPRGGKWNASTISGSVSRANGILQNRLYVGEMVWNRQRFIKDPATGKRVSRHNPERDWIRSEVPHLKIIDQEVFDAVQARKADRTKRYSRGERVTRPKQLLTGLMKCGCCGASYTMINRDRLGCAGHRERGDCANAYVISRQEVEGRVLKALHTQMLDPDTIRVYVAAYIDEQDRIQKEHRSNIKGLSREYGEKQRQAERLLHMITTQEAEPTDAEYKAYYAARKEAEEVKRRMDAANESKPPAIELHRGAIEQYAKMVGELRRMSAEATPVELLETVRKLISRVVIMPPAAKGGKAGITLQGVLAELMRPPEDVGQVWLRGPATTAHLQAQCVHLAA